MKRRLVLKQIALTSAAMWLLPSCITDPKKLSIALQHLSITGDEEELVGDIADVIVPVTDTPGARAVGAHLFALIMVDDCLSKKDQELYLKGMRSFDETVNTVIGKSFAKGSQEERLKVLEQLDQHPDKFSDDVKFFYAKTRAYILQGYLSSEHFLTHVKPYQLIPGAHFNGCVPVSNKI